MLEILVDSQAANPRRYNLIRIRWAIDRPFVQTSRSSHWFLVGCVVVTGGYFRMATEKAALPA